MNHDVPAVIKSHQPFGVRTWFATGGNAAFCAEPTTTDEFRAVLQWALRSNLPSLVVGDGANMLVSDGGYKGIVIRPALKDIQYVMSDTLGYAWVTAGSGVLLPELIDYCLDHGMGGLEEFSGIPGTIGGSVYINVHYFEFLLSSFLVHAQVIDRLSGEVLMVDNSWFAFGYNQSTLQAGTHYLISATFKMRIYSPTEAAYARGRRDEMIRHRKRRYPYVGTCGSFFRNFSQQEVAAVGRSLIYVGYYLDTVGVKGTLQSGKAAVSYQHANMIVASPGATTADVIAVARGMQERVYAQYGLVPQPECVLVGFDTYPLMR